MRSQDCGKRLLASSYLSVCPHGTPRLRPDEFSWNLIFEYFSKKKIVKKILLSLKSDRTKITLTLYKTNIHFFYVHGFVHRKSVLINVQRDVTICRLYFMLLQYHSTCFGCGRHPKHVERFCRKIKYRLNIVASRWKFTNIDHDTFFIKSRSVLLNTLRTGLLNCLNARSRGLNFRHRASCI